MKRLEYLRIGFAVLVTGLFVLNPALSLRAAEQSLPLLKSKTGTYTNVTVTTKSKNYIFILHSSGMANLKVDDLPPETKLELGYEVPQEKKAQPTLVFAKQLPPQIQATLQPVKERWSSAVPWTMKDVKEHRNWIAIGAAVLFVLHVFGSFCCHKICMKCNQPASVLVWFPFLQAIPLLRAAGMSGWWLLMLLIPVLNLLPAILWSFKIAKARQKSPLVGLLLLLPITGPLAFLYLAFSAATPAETETKFKSMSLQTA